MNNIVINEISFNEASGKGIAVFREDGRYDSKAAFTVNNGEVEVLSFYYHKCNEECMAKEIAEYIWG